MSPRLTTLVEAESLFNDGTSIVALSLILAYVSGTSSGAVALAAQFVVVVCGGAVVGGAIAFAIVRLARRINDPMIEIALTTIAAYASFVVAEDLGLSGVIATVVAGLMLGAASREASCSPETRVAADAFWRYVAFALNSIVFLLIGFEVHPSALLASAGTILAAFVSVVLARAAVVTAVGTLLSRTSERLPRSWALVITWGGLRGALAMVLALALPAEFPKRALLIDLTFGIVIGSLLIQGLTIPLITERILGARATARDDESRPAANEPRPVGSLDS